MRKEYNIGYGGNWGGEDPHDAQAGDQGSTWGDVIKTMAIMGAAAATAGAATGAFAGAGAAGAGAAGTGAAGAGAAGAGAAGAGAAGSGGFIGGSISGGLAGTGTIASGTGLGLSSAAGLGGAFGTGGAGLYGGLAAGAGGLATTGGGAASGGMGAASGGSSAAGGFGWKDAAKIGLDAYGGYKQAEEAKKAAADAAKGKSATTMRTPYYNEAISLLIPYILQNLQNVFQSRMQTYGGSAANFDIYRQLLGGIPSTYSGVGMPGSPVLGR